MAHPLVKRAAVIADTFGLDPVLVAGERNAFRRLLRLAANNIVADLHSKQK